MMHVSNETAVKVIYWNVLAATLVVGLATASFIRQIHRYDRLIIEAAREHQLDPRLVSSIVWKESRYDHTRVGKAGEIGLMQLTEAAAMEWAESAGLKDFKMDDLYDPHTNLRAGSWYLARAIQSWSDRVDPVPYALAEYNAGRSNALRWSKQVTTDARDFWHNITYPGTKHYVRDILLRYRGRV